MESASESSSESDDDEPSSIVLHGVEVSAKRKRGLSETELDNIHSSMYNELESLKRQVAIQNDKIEKARAALKVSGYEDSDRVVASTAVVVVSDTSTSTPAAVVPNNIQKAFKLAPNHKNAFLNNITLHVESWANEPQSVDVGQITNSKNDTDFPHRLRGERNGAVMKWVETFPRKVNLVVSMRYKSTNGALIDNNFAVLKHANALLPPGSPRLSELKFTCKLVTADAENGYDTRFRPRTSIKSPLFKNPSSCISWNNGEPTESFFHHGNGGTPVVQYTASMTTGRVIFPVCFSEQCLSSRTLNPTDGVWRLAIRAAHPALMNLINFSVLTPPFSTGRRVRSVKVKKQQGS